MFKVEIDTLVRDYRDGKDVSLQIQDLNRKLVTVDNLGQLDYRWLSHTLNNFKPKGKHVMIINDLSLMLSPHGIREGKIGAGSEEALLVVSEGLAKLGYRVTVVCETLPFAGYTLPSMNPRYYPLGGFETSDLNVDVCLAWRNTRFYRYYRFTRAPVISIQHDQFSSPFSTCALEAIGYMSQQQLESFHKSMPSLKEIKNVVVGNGINPEEFDSSVAKSPLKCVYITAYHRGLRGVLESWPEIIKQHPEATLDIYYGRECWGLITQQELNELVSMMSQPGVTEKGKVSHHQLANVISQASFMVNVSTFFETYSISTAKALAGGCIPVITDTVDKAIVPPQITLIDHRAADRVHQFKDKLITTMTKAKSGELDDLREACRSWAANNLSWEASIARYAELIETMC